MLLFVSTTRTRGWRGEVGLFFNDLKQMSFCVRGMMSGCHHSLIFWGGRSKMQALVEWKVLP
jgi:hypothetical protein